MCKAAYWSGVVNPSAEGGDHRKPQDGDVVFSGWSTGQPQFHFYRVAKKKEEEKTTRKNRKNSRFGVDRLTTPDATAALSGGIRWSPRRAGGLTTPDHLGEVTL
jgi:hypothetical protein